MKKEYYYILGGAFLLLLLTRKTKARCPLPEVLQWQPLAAEISWANENVFRRSVEAEILAVIHDQSQGNPNQVYYSGGVWQKYGLCGVPLAWAQEFSYRMVNPEDLLNPQTNIETMLRILAYIDIKIWKAYQQSGISGAVSPGLSANAYSAYCNSNTMNISDVRDPNIHNRDNINRYLDLLVCYRKEW